MCIRDRLDIDISELILNNVSLIEIWRPFPIETALSDTNIPTKTEKIAIFIIRDEILLLSVLVFNFL